MIQTTFAHYVAYGLIAIGALLPMVVCWRLLTKGRKLCVQKDFRGVRTLYVQHMQLVVFVSVLLIFVTLALGLSPVASLLLIPSFVLPVVAVEWWVLHRHYPRARLFELLPQVAPYQHAFSVKIPANEQAVGESLAGIRQFMTNMLPHSGLLNYRIRLCTEELLEMISEMY